MDNSHSKIVQIKSLQPKHGSAHYYSHYSDGSEWSWTGSTASNKQIFGRYSMAKKIYFQKKFTVLFDRIEYKSNYKHFKLAADLSEDNVINMTIIVTKPIDVASSRLEVTVVQFLQYRNLSVLNGTFQFCQMKANRDREFFRKIFTDIFNKFSNLPLKCPIMPGSYYFENFTLRNLELPSYTRDTKYRSKYQMFIKGNNSKLVSFAYFICYGSIRSE